MKKRIIALAMALALLLLTGAGVAEALPTENLVHISDESGILSAEQAAALEAKLDEVYAKSGIDLIVATTDNSEGKTASLYAADFYDAFRDYDTYPDGAALVFMFDIGQYYEVSRGKAQSILDAGDADDALAGGIEDKDYAQALIDWADYASGCAVPASPFVRAARLVWIMLILGVIVALIAVLVMKHSLLTAKSQQAAGEYVCRDSLDLDDSSADIFLYETVEQRKIERDDSSGGGSEHVTSSSGNDYSGHGGSL